MSKSYNFKQYLGAIFLLLSVLTGSNVKAQSAYGNEWINYSQAYYKIKVSTTGLYQLDYNYLNSLGLANVNPQHLQLFRRGQEVSIYVAGEADGKLDPQDYIEFFGERNDGVLDEELYKNPEHQIHQLRSLYTDTAAYFLTYSAVGGKRMRETNPAINGRTPEPYHLQKAIYVNADRYNRGKKYGENYMPWMDQGEGYLSHYSINPRTYNISGVTNIETTGPNPVLEFGTVGAFPEYHTFDVNITSGGSTRKLDTYEYDFFAHKVDKKQIRFSEIANNLITLQILPLSTPTRGNAISFAHGVLTYPQKPIFTGNSMFLYTDSTRGNTPYFALSNTPATAIAYDVTDQGDIARISGFVVGSKRGYVVPAGDGKSHKVLLADVSKALKPEPAKKIIFRNIAPDAYNYIILTNKRLMVKAGGYNEPAPKAYASYRASEAGGGYDTLVVFIDDLVNQYHYGEFSSNAIRRFLSFMLTAPNPKQMLILGKGVEIDRVNYRSAAGMALDLVPVGGIPGSDVFFSADFRNNSYYPRVPTGRVSATSATDIINYLNKVKEYENLPQGVAWRKNFLQLGGGTSPSEISLIKNYLNTYANIASGPLLGAKVVEKYRQNVSEVVEVVKVADEVNAGLSMITFFGHSSPGTTDLDIGYASSPLSGYNNKGKYPVMLMNGCNAGHAFLPNNVSFGEDWIMTPDKGAIAFIAHVEWGYPNYLNLYSHNLYTTAFQSPEFYGKPLGILQSEVIKKVKATSTSDLATAMVLEMLLQGDPAVKFYSPDKPDYLINDNAFTVLDEDGSTVTASSPQFTINVKAGNLGKVITEPVKVKVKRTLPNSTVIEYDPIIVAPINTNDIISLEINNEGVDALGMNAFEIILDGLNEVEELNEENNSKRFQYFFPASGLTALSPADYSIVNSNSVKLTVQATQGQTAEQEYYFELDTTQAFNSSLKKSYIAASSLLPTWEVTLPSLPNNDSIVFYWRARFQNYQVGEDTIWSSNSFRYIPGGQHGWSQSHSGQFTNAVLSNISDTGNLKWEFKPIKMEINIRTAGGAIRYSDPNYGLYINGQSLISIGCGNPASSAAPRMYMVVLDNRTLERISNLSPGACSVASHLYTFGDMNNATNRANLEAFLKAVPNNYYVAAIGLNNVPYESFSASLKSAFNSIGSTVIDNLKNGYPFAIVGQKGAAPGTANELTASAGDPTPAISQSIRLEVTLNSNQQQGSITSTVIGPAVNWGTLFHNVEHNQGGEDVYNLSVLGIDTTGRQVLLVDNVNSKAFDISGINAETYPNLQLLLQLSDEKERTAPQLKEWFIYFEGAPEGVIRPDLVTLSEQVLSEQANKGSLTMPMAFQNISNTAFSDSLTVEVTVTGDNLQPIVSYFKIEPLAGSKTVYFDYTLPTNELEGNYKISMYVNPRKLLEQQYSNNVYEIPFKVKGKLHPIMDVAFDGIHIMDGELVSPSPLVSVTVKDENQGRYLHDASTMSIVLINPHGQEQEVSIENNPQEIQYYPADEKNDFRLEYKPATLEDGNYTMEVRARDVAGKASGISPYRISFVVVNESTISNFYPYPNPFSTKTNFIFTLTGATVPDNFKIQILTVTGKVVKEIMKEEIGPIRVGNNKSDYAWDGTDMYGDKLANGVYLYRVVMSKDGVEDMKHRNTFGDKAFKNGYGKLYILR